MSRSPDLRDPPRIGRCEHTDVDVVPLAAFGLADELEPGLSPPHAHRKHQLLYAESGSL